MKTISKIDPVNFKLITRPAFINNGMSAVVDPYILTEISEFEKVLIIKCIKAIEKTSDKELRKGHEQIPEYQIDHNKDVFSLSIEDLYKELKSKTSNKNLYDFSRIIDEEGINSQFDDVSEIVKTSQLGFNVLKVLTSKPILEYLCCKAYISGKKQDASSIFKYIINEYEGVKEIIDFLTIGAAIKIININKLKVDDLTNIKSILLKSNITFSFEIFTREVTNIVKQQVFNQDWYNSIPKDFIEKNDVTDEEILALINYIKQPKLGIKPYEKEKIKTFLPIALNDIRSGDVQVLSGSDYFLTSSDFTVRYYEDEKSALEIDRENILCAAQLFYVMTLGEELEIFNVINRIITKYLPGGQVDIRSRATLQDLQLYVFNDSFRDLKNGAVFKRTQPEERRMFYKQVFSAGNADVVDSMVVNSSFNSLWEKLLIEVVKYIDKVEKSDSPQLYISRQNICQAMEDLQYNLSTHCSGMAKVAAPIMNKELDFIIEQFLKNSELIKQLALNNSGSFWKVIERVITDMRNEMPNVSALRNKAVYGHRILSSIATYSPSDLDNDKTFSEFLSTIEAFIIANSQIENSGNNILSENEDRENEDTSMPVTGGQNEWDF